MAMSSAIREIGLQTSLSQLPGRQQRGSQAYDKSVKNRQSAHRTRLAADRVVTADLLPTVSPPNPINGSCRLLLRPFSRWAIRSYIRTAIAIDALPRTACTAAALMIPLSPALVRM
jgi:hypothetical protein